ncbi:MAG: MBL fold metallo-hydrolase [Planctomycetota bacterium]|nr:MBL fold metallo-hydrolase [Planctomycetota bacterium]
MLPKPPPRESSLGFLYLPPYRVQGLSVAGEATCIQIPELDLCFDMGSCPRAALASNFVALSHGHMDHVGGLAYYCSQRRFQGMGDGTIVCDARIESDVRTMLEGFQALERQVTPFNLVPLQEDEVFKLKNNVSLKGFHTEHTAPSMGYSIIEHRTKLKPEYTDFPQEKLRELKNRGEEITRNLEVPLISYLGDTAAGSHLLRDDVLKSKIIITECTFFDPGHRGRANIGKHLHAADIAEWLRVAECDAMVLVHVSRRTHLGEARAQLTEGLREEDIGRVHFLMDHRTNRMRYEQQLAEAEAAHVKV